MLSKNTHQEIVDYMKYITADHRRLLLSVNTLKYGSLGIILTYIFLIICNFFEFLFGQDEFSDFLSQSISAVFISTGVMVQVFGWLYPFFIGISAFVYVNCMYWNWRTGLPYNLDRTEWSVVGVISGFIVFLATAAIWVGFIDLMKKLPNS